MSLSDSTGDRGYSPMIWWAAVLIIAAIVGYVIAETFGSGRIFGLLVALIIGWLLGRYLEFPRLSDTEPAPGYRGPQGGAPGGGTARPAQAAPSRPAPSQTAQSSASPAGTAAATGAAAPQAASKPATLAAPREGGGDDLKRIKGVGPKLEEMLHGLGFYHFDQIAAWSPSEVAWVDSNIEGFTGRATRDDWVGQAKLLAAGRETEFSQRVDKGEVYE